MLRFDLSKHMMVMNINKLNKKSRRENERKAWDQFIANLAGKTKPAMKDLLDSVLSEKEKQNIVYRITTINLLEQGKSYRDIGRELWLSSQTISVIKKSFMLKIGDYKSYRSASRQKRVYSASMSPKKKQFKSARPKFSVLDAWDVHEYRKRVKNSK